MSKKVTACAIVTITVEIPANGAWGGDCPLSQIHKQAVDSVRDKLARGSVQSGDGDNRSGLCSWRIIGEPKVRSIVTEEER